jgi:plasmid stabilization system protein ParE
MEPVVAINQVSRIKTGIYSLNTFPKRYPLVRDKMLAAKGYRCMFIDNYTVFYIVSETSKSVSSNTVEISRIQYSRRNWIDLL